MISSPSFNIALLFRFESRPFDCVYIFGIEEMSLLTWIFE